MKKNKLQLWLVGCLTFVLSSCLGGEDNKIDEWGLSNCQISSFSLKNDSIPGLDKVKFTIDQINGLIFNKDSMPYGTKIDWKVVCTMGFETGSVSAIRVYQVATGDSIYWNRADSLDFSGSVNFDVYSIDGKEVKKYIAKLNVHQQSPDSMTWQRYTDKLLGVVVQEQKVIVRDANYWMYVKGANGYELYRSSLTDRMTWDAVSLTGLTDKTVNLSQITEYNQILYVTASDGSLYESANGKDWTILAQTPVVKALLGTIDAAVQVKHPSALSAIVQEGDEWFFASMGEDKQWKTGAPVPSAFPVAGFGNTNYETVYYPRLMVVAGKDRNGQLSNMAWETMNGLSWVCMTDEKASFFSKREGVMLTQYDDKLFLIGGINASNKAEKDIYFSKNKGITWTLADTLVVLPETYKARGYASVWVDENQFMLLFGGKENNGANALDELWSGRINRLGFKE